VFVLESKIEFWDELIKSIDYQTTASYNRLQEEVGEERLFYSANSLSDMKIVFSAYP